MCWDVWVLSWLSPDLSVGQLIRNAIHDDQRELF
jgi:hypothetical protein